MNHVSSLVISATIVAFGIVVIGSSTLALPIESVSAPASIPASEPVKFINGTCFSVTTNGSCVNTTMAPPMSNLTLVNGTCDLCLGMVSMVKADITMVNGSIANITHFIDMVCSHIAGPSAKECVIFSKSIEKVVSELHHGLNVSQVCHGLGMC